MPTKNKKDSPIINGKFRIDPYLQNPYHAITITVIGAGGNGTAVLAALAKLNWAMIKTGRSQLKVQCYDPDIVTESNVARQLFYPQDIGENKAKTIITRINRSYGYDWTYRQTKISERIDSNIVIGCVDSIASRRDIYTLFTKESNSSRGNVCKFFWLDTGNGADFGQIILSDYKEYLPCVLDFVDYDDKRPNQPSCSTFESLQQQGLYMNSLIGTFAGQILWDLFRSVEIDYHGIFINMEKGKISKLMI